jgi:hypothetical protein
MDATTSGRVTVSTSECLDLLRTQSVGRIAYTDRALPAIGLVAYEVINTTLQLRSDKALSVALRDAVVAFQSDNLSLGWAVTCVGRVTAVPGVVDVMVLEPTLLTGWRSPARAN